MQVNDMFRLLLMLQVLLACSSSGSLMPQAPKSYVWPQPPDRPRFQYETVLRSADSIKEPVKKGFLERFATATVQERVARNVFLKPYAIVAQHGRIYVTDTALALVHVFDVPRRRYFQFGYRLEGKLSKPVGIALDGQGLVYVTDAGAKRVVVFDAYGLFQRFIGHGDGLQNPIGVAVTKDGSRIYVIDRGELQSAQHGVVEYDASGKRVRFIGQRGRAPGQFNLPLAAQIGSKNELFVLDAGNFRVQVFSLDGKYLRSWGKVGQFLGAFARPRSMAIDVDDNVYVADSAFGNVQIFNAQGQLLLALGDRQSSQSEPGHYPLIAGVTVDETRRVYIVDQFYRKVEVMRYLSEQEAQVLQKALSLESSHP